MIVIDKGLLWGPHVKEYYVHRICVQPEVVE